MDTYYYYCHAGKICAKIQYIYAQQGSNFFKKISTRVRVGYSYNVRMDTIFLTGKCTDFRYLYFYAQCAAGLCKICTKPW